MLSPKENGLAPAGEENRNSQSARVESNNPSEKTESTYRKNCSATSGRNTHHDKRNKEAHTADAGVAAYLRSGLSGRDDRPQPGHFPGKGQRKSYRAYNYNTYTQADKESGSYVGVASGSQNFGPTNPALTERVEKDMAEFLKANPSIKKEDIPTDLLTASGSGLEPYISPAAAAVQIPALVETTGLSKEQLESIVKAHTRGKILGVFGGETVNVLRVNLDIANALGLLPASR